MTAPSDTQRLKYAVEGCINGIWGDEPNGEDDLVVVRVADFNRERCSVELGDSPTMRAVPESARGRRLLKRGDLLIEKSGGGEQQPVGNVVLFSEDVPAVCSNFVARMPVAADCDSRYMAYVFRALYAEGRNIPHIKQTSGIQNLDSESYLNERVWLPTKSTQQRIANFLDEQTARIDALISEKEKLVGRLQELRLSRMSAAVGGGSSPEVAPGADLSKLFPAPPAGWRLTRVGFLASKIGSGKTPGGGAEVYLKEGIPLIRSMNVYDEGMRMDEVAYISPEMDQELAATRLQANDILLNITGASIGRSCLVPAEILPANINQHTCIIRLKDKSLAPYVSLALKSAQTKAQIDAFQNGAAREGLNFAQVSCIAVLLPPSSEQADEVARSVERALSNIDAAKSHTSEHIERLREYRSSLISAAVTGQLDASTVKELA